MAVNLNLPQKKSPRKTFSVVVFLVFNLHTFTSTLSSTKIKRSNPQHTHITPPLDKQTHTLCLCHSPLCAPPRQPTPDVRAQREPSHIQSVSHFLPRVKVKHHLCVGLRAFPIARAITLYLAAGQPGSLTDGFASWRTAKGCRGREAFSLPASHLFSPHKRQNT